MTAIMLIIGIVPVLLLALAVHEAGHLIAGRMAGLRFALFGVGPVLVMRQEQGLCWMLNKNLALYGGIAASVPETLESLRRRFFWFVTGGPLMSLLFGLAVLLVYALLDLDMLQPETHPPAAVYAGLALFLLGVMSFGLGLGTLFPNQVMGLPSDGARLMKLWRPGAEAEREAAVMAIMSFYIIGRRPRTWEEAIVEQALAVPDGSYMDVAAHHMAYLRALDQGATRQAGNHLQYALAHLDQVHANYRPDLMLEAAYFEAVYRQNVTAARAWMQRAGKGAVVDELTRQRAEAAVLWADHEEEAARRKTAQVRSKLVEQGIGASSFLLDELKRLEQPVGR